MFFLLKSSVLFGFGKYDLSCKILSINCKYYCNFVCVRESK